jgi:hypothetical protein
MHTRTGVGKKRWRVLMKIAVGLAIGFIALGFVPALLKSLASVGMKMDIGKSFVLCSRFEGVLVDKDGRAAPHVRIERTWNWGWNGKSGLDETVSDAQGRFVLPRVTGRSLTAGLLPHEPGVDQQITAHGPAGTVLLFSVQKRNYSENGELDGRPLNVVCRIDKQPSGDGLFWGTCIEAK